MNANLMNAVEMLPTLTRDSVAVGLYIISATNPEWGIMQIAKSGDTLTYKSGRGEAVLFDGDFKFWKVVGNFAKAFAFAKSMKIGF